MAGKASGGPSWLYYFPYVPQALRALRPGASHASEIPFVFDTWDKLGRLSELITLTPQDKAMTALVHGCWVAFAKTGKPGCADAPAWPEYTTARDTLMDFDDAPPSLKTNFRKPQLDAQEAAGLPKLGLGN